MAVIRRAGLTVKASTICRSQGPKGVRHGPMKASNTSHRAALRSAPGGHGGWPPT
jgi:hypothetical protein